MKEVIHFQQLCIYSGKLPKTELILGIHWILAEYLITSNETHVVVAVSSAIPAGMYLVPFSKRGLVFQHLCTGNQLARNFIFKKGLRNAAHRNTTGCGCSGGHPRQEMSSLLSVGFAALTPTPVSLPQADKMLFLEA